MSEGGGRDGRAGPATPGQTKERYFHMKKMTAALLCVLMMLALSACSKKASGGEDVPSNGGLMQIPNPWLDCSSLDEAAKAAGFDIAIPGKFEGYPNRVYRAMEKSMIEVIYYDSDPSDENSSSVTVRKGTGEDDISGDYNSDAEEETAQMHGVDVLLRGDKGLVYCATWTKDGYSYAITADKGLTKEAVSAAVEEMMTVPG